MRMILHSKIYKNLFKIYQRMVENANNRQDVNQ
jgi:hypothetical protein